MVLHLWEVSETKPTGRAEPFRVGRENHSWAVVRDKGGHLGRASENGSVKILHSLIR